MTDTPKPPISPPLAERRQHAVTQFGVTRDDPYAWLRADNWQEVMQSPELLPGDVRQYLESENAYFMEDFETPHAALTEAIFREIRGRHQGGRQRHSDARRRLGLQFAHAGGETISADRSHPAQRGRRDSAARLQCRSRRQLFRLRRRRALARPCAAELGGRPAGVGILHHPHPRPGERQGHRRGDHRGGRWRHLGAGRTLDLLYRVRREPPAVPGAPAPVGHAAECGRDRVRGCRPRLLRRRRRDAEPELHRHRRARPPDLGSVADRPRGRLAARWCRRG